MNDRFKSGFGQMLETMPESPTWERVSAQHLASPTPSPAPPNRGGRGPLVALVSFVVTVVVIVAGVMVAQGGDSDTVASSTVAYVRLAWSQEVETRCRGLETVDNGGFERATIEIWGPNAQGLVRVDATAPDGTVERLIVERDPLNPAPLRVWSTYTDAMRTDTVFRTFACIQEGSSGGTSTTYLATSPIIPEKYGLLAYFVAIPVLGEDGLPLDVVDRLASTSKVREAEWRGMPVTVYERSDSGVDRFGTYKEVIEVWLDPSEPRYERVVFFFDQELVGSVKTVTEVVERGAEAASGVSFSLEDLTLSLDYR